MGTDDRHKKRKARNTKAKRIEQKAVLIALEDTKSSKYYFESLIKDKKLTGKVIFAKHIGTNPKKVLEALRRYKEENPKTKFEKEWIVIDKDDWSKDEFNNVIESARRENICIAFSNEAYELWVLLHFEPITRYSSRQELNSRLNRIFKERFNLEYSKSSYDIYAFTVGFQHQAITNAKKLLAMHQKNQGKIDPYESNPLTMTFELVECLNTLYTTEQQCNCFPYRGSL